ncbi:hypothetical protein EDB89DRAFT_2228258 [Lactarius sanguifluus]|nr:hypothetical protein EDB89DRAFT_2228258 [Lactarius sanguifluus]
MSDISSTPSLTPQSSGCILSKCQMPRTSHRSVAKRERVMALGSVEDPQHYSTSPRQGLLPKEEGLVPAIGSLSAHIKANPLLSGLPELDFPPSPALLAPSFHPFTPYVKTFEVDPENLRPGVTLTCRSPNNGFDVLRTLNVTAHAIRSVRNYLLSLYNELGHTQPRQGFRLTSLSTSEPQKRRVVSRARIAPTRSRASGAQH